MLVCVCVCAVLMCLKTSRFVSCRYLRRLRRFKEWFQSVVIYSLLYRASFLFDFECDVTQAVFIDIGSFPRVREFGNCSHSIDWVIQQNFLPFFVCWTMNLLVVYSISAFSVFHSTSIGLTRKLIEMPVVYRAQSREYH